MALVDPKVDVAKMRKDVDQKKISDDNIIDSGDLLLYDIIKRKRKTETILNKALQQMSITR